MRTTSSLIAALLLLATLPAPVSAASAVPRAVGQCVATTIKEVGSRLEGVPDSGSAVSYANGIFGISYETVKELARAKVGDKVELCLTLLPKDCPPGDDRGKTFMAIDLRTQTFWELPDSEHLCGGA